MSAPTSPQRILIVDDVPVNLVMLESLIAGKGIEVIKATSGEEAIKLSKKYELSLILLDVVMPDMSGYEVAEAIRSFKRTQYVPIIFVTASSKTDDNLLKSYESGVADVLYKPLNPTVIKSKVKIFLELDSQRQLIKKQSHDLKDAFERLQDYAQHDQLTGLYNRDQIINILNRIMANARRHGSNMAVLFLDLDHFKHINDSLGHDVGDMLLKSVADRVRSSVREGDFVARLGGDEFAVILNELDSEKSASLVAQKILDKLVVPHSLKDHEIIVSSSIGIALFDESYDTSAALLKAADAAMYQAKQKGRSQFAFFSPELEEQAVKRMAIARGLNDAIDGNKLSIFYQPQVDTLSKKVVGFEALMRWENDGEWVSPALFIPIAEETGLIPKMGEWILRQSCLQLIAWQKAGLIEPDVKMSVNISLRQIQSGNFLDVLDQVLKETKVNPHCLEFELTESSVMDDPERAITIFRNIHDLGIEISVDDFGTGYSSLNYLRHLPIDCLKVDQSFIKDIGVDENDEAIVKVIIGLAHNLGLNVIAEGVETETQCKFLIDNNCNVLQGYLISRPIPPEQVVEFLKKHKSLDQV